MSASTFLGILDARFKALVFALALLAVNLLISIQLYLELLCTLSFAMTELERKGQ